MALGVRQQVLDDALELGRVDSREHTLGLYVDLAPVRAPGDDVAHELREIRLLELDPQPPVPQPVDVEEVVEQPLEAGRLARDEVDHLLAPFVGEGRPALAQRDGEAEDRGQRRAELVGNGGENVLANLLDPLALGRTLNRAGLATLLGRQGSGAHDVGPVLGALHDGLRVAQLRERLAHPRGELRPLAPAR